MEIGNQNQKHSLVLKIIHLQLKSDMCYGCDCSVACGKWQFNRATLFRDVFQHILI